eukprot:1154232-Rhodomonas_salina.2
MERDCKQADLAQQLPAAPPALRTPHSSLLTAHMLTCSPLAVHCSLPTAPASRLTAHGSHAHCSLLTAHCAHEPSEALRPGCSEAKAVVQHQVVEVELGVPSLGLRDAPVVVQVHVQPHQPLQDVRKVRALPRRRSRVHLSRRFVVSGRVVIESGPLVALRAPASPAPSKRAAWPCRTSRPAVLMRSVRDVGKLRT